jgi:tetratricopeptide (TPR) repeat protein
VRRLSASLALLNLGEIARKRGDFARASALLEEALATVRANEMTWGIANILTMLGHLARGQQEYARAKARYRESLAIYQRLGNATYTAWCLEGIAAVAGAEQRYAHATMLYAAAATLRHAAQTPLPPTEQEEVDTVVMTARAELDEPRRTTALRWSLSKPRLTVSVGALLTCHMFSKRLLLFYRLTPLLTRDNFSLVRKNFCQEHPLNLFIVVYTAIRHYGQTIILISGLSQR